MISLLTTINARKCCTTGTLTVVQWLIMVLILRMWRCGHRGSLAAVPWMILPVNYLIFQGWLIVSFTSIFKKSSNPFSVVPIALFRLQTSPFLVPPNTLYFASQDDETTRRPSGRRTPDHDDESSIVDTEATDNIRPSQETTSTASHVQLLLLYAFYYTRGTRNYGMVYYYHGRRPCAREIDSVSRHI